MNLGKRGIEVDAWGADVGVCVGGYNCGVVDFECCGDVKRIGL